MSDGISDAYKDLTRKQHDGVVNKPHDPDLCLAQGCAKCRQETISKLSNNAEEHYNRIIQQYDTPTLEDNHTITITGTLELKEGTKYDAGKPTTALLPSQPLLEIAKVLDYGASKYAPHNWTKGIKYSRVLSAAQRHMLAWNEGESVDPETGISHLAHAACNLLFLLDYEARNMIEFDDRRKK